MTYRLGRSESESVSDGIRRVVLEQLDQACADLEGWDEHDHDERIHDARRRLKKARAALRLVRPALGEATFQRENACLRDAARELGGARQAAAVLECFRQLRQTYAGELPPDAFSGVERLLVDAKARALVGTLDGGVEEQVVRTLRLAAHRSPSWTLSGKDGKAIAGGLENTYARGRRAFKRAYARPSTANFHEWRKRAKYHWYHVRLLQSMWPKPMKARRHALGELADLLGDDHDLGDLRSVLRAVSPELAADLHVDRLLSLVARHEQQLRARAKHIGRRIYAEPPKQLVARFASYFKSWQAHSAPLPAQAGADESAADDDASCAPAGRSTST